MGTDTSGGGGHAAPVEDRLAGYLGVLEREAEAHGERPSVEVTCDFNYTLNLPSSKVRETRGTPSYPPRSNAEENIFVRLRVTFEPFAFAIRPTRPPTTRDVSDHPRTPRIHRTPRRSIAIS